MEVIYKVSYFRSRVLWGGSWSVKEVLERLSTT